MEIFANQSPLVSIAVISYNQAEFINDCIDSIINQLYRPIEIIVADDGSRDGTQDILKDYASRYPESFRLILSDKNEGITFNSNKAHHACKGKYISWIGGDDEMLPSKIKKQVEFMENNPQCSICYHKREVFDHATGEIMAVSNNYDPPLEGGMSILIRHGPFNGACTTMVRKVNTPSKGFDIAIPVASDWLYWIETLENGGTINFLNEMLSRYRRHERNVTNPSKSLTQNEIDSLNTCNILLKKYPHNSSDIYFRISFLYFNLRRKLHYGRALGISLSTRVSIKSLIGLTAYLLTFRKVKL